MIRWLRLRWRESDLPLYLLTALVTGLVTVVALELWTARFDVPFTYEGDGIAIAAHFKTVMETGWYEFQPLLSAPFGQTYNDFPTADNLNFLAARVITLFTADSVVAMNLYFVIGFVAAALSALWLFRRLKLSAAVSLALAVVFAIAPYHFIRGEGHLWLASYYIVPLSIGLVIMALRGEPLWARPAAGSTWRLWLVSPAVTTVVIVILTGTVQTYYAVFFLVLLAFAGVVRLIGTGQWRRFWGAVTVGVLTAIVMLVNMLPDIVFSWVNGANSIALERDRTETEWLGLKVAQLLLPWSGHRIPYLKAIRDSYDTTYPLPSELPALGAIAAAGFVALFLSLAYVAATGRNRRVRSELFTERFTLFTGIAALTFVSFLFSTVGGLSTLVSFATSSLRGWNRLSIVIALLSLIGVGILLDAAVRALRSRLASRPRLLAAVPAALVIVVIGIAYVDQTPSGSPANDYVDAWDADARWFATVDDALTAEALVLQLPYQPFPETVGPTGMQSTEVLIPYLHTTDIGWSGGGIRGRPRADWPAQFAGDDPAQIAVLASTAGFSGIHIDTDDMYPSDARELEAGLRQYLGEEPLASADGRYLFFSLLDEGTSIRERTTDVQREAIRARVFLPLTVEPDGAFVRWEFPDGIDRPRALTDTPGFQLGNPTPTSRQAALTIRFHLDDDARAADALVTLPDGTTRLIPLAEGRGEVVVTTDVPPGTSLVTLHVNGATVSAPIPVVLDGVDLGERSLAEFVRDAGHPEQ